MTDKQVMQQALDALLGYKPYSLTHAKEQGSAIIALRAAIAQPVQTADGVRHAIAVFKHYTPPEGFRQACEELRAQPEQRKQTALEEYKEGMAGHDYGAIENLRYFCSIAMRPNALQDGQDWLDVEAFFDAVLVEVSSAAIAQPEQQTDLQQQNQQLRDQNTALDLRCAEYEKLAQPKAKYTTGHCEEKAGPKGCQLHNLQCGYPKCDRKSIAQPKDKPERVKECFMCHGKGWHYVAHAYPLGMTAPETKVKCAQCVAQQKDKP